MELQTPTKKSKRKRNKKAKNNANKKASKKGKYDNYVSAPSNGRYFLFDVETTDSKRNWDRIIVTSILVFDETGLLLGSFSKKVNPGKARISNFLSDNIRGKFLVM